MLEANTRLLNAPFCSHPCSVCSEERLTVAKRRRRRLGLEYGREGRSGGMGGRGGKGGVGVWAGGAGRGRGMGGRGGAGRSQGPAAPPPAGHILARLLRQRNDVLSLAFFFYIFFLKPWEY